jgi:NADH-quinone oxidoreductase subunit F
MSELDLLPIQEILSGLARPKRADLLPVLHDAQAVYGYLPEEVLIEISRTLLVPLADIQGVVDFYSMFYDKPVGKTVVRVCTDPACALKGSDQLLARACESTGAAVDSTSLDQRFQVERVTCLGMCEQAPAALFGQMVYGELDEAGLDRALRYIPPAKQTPLVYGELNILTRRCRGEQTTRLASYFEQGGYQALEKALDMPASAVIAEVKAAGLVGRGGAAFPTGVKWEGAAHAPGSQRYVICNADESEPGTFKDRILMENDPHSIIEGMIIAAHAIQSNYGYIYIRGEYPTAYRTIQNALYEAYQAGLLGDNVLGRGFHFDIEVRLGAGAYICGEETALFESIEGKRGCPRLKPPFPTTHGLFGLPTVINNVETLCNVPYIILRGAAAYRKIGTEKSPGPKLFCVSGDVVRPGLYEVPFGITLRHLLYDLAGGIAEERALKTVLFGGAAGAFATPEQLDIPLAFETLKSVGLPLGSGVVMVFDERRDLRDAILRLTRFFAHESCGKCYPCQMGTQRQYEIMQRVAAGKTLPGDIQRLQDIGWTMTDASICGLGQTAASAVLSAMKIWPELFSE